MDRVNMPYSIDIYYLGSGLGWLYVGKICKTVGKGA